MNQTSGMYDDYSSTFYFIKVTRTTNQSVIYFVPFQISGKNVFVCWSQITIGIMEEQIGEFVIRVVHLTFTLTSGVVICGVMLLTGDIFTTTQYNLLTASAIPTGALI